MVFSLIAVLAGLSLMAASLFKHRVRQQQGLDELFGWPSAPGRIVEGNDNEISGLAERAVGLAGQAVAKVDRRRSLGVALERARLPVRPGEYVLVTSCAGLGVAALLLALTHSRPLAMLAPLGAAAFAVFLVRRRIAKRKRAFETQLPNALSLIASSLYAGHTFLRAIQMMCEESNPPMAEEFSRVVAETQLGDTLVNALERMAQRMQVRDMDMVVQAVRIQQTVGGRLADLLHTLSDFIRARFEVRREVQVLTAEGRMSAYVLAGLVPFLLLVIQFMNPGYVEPLYSGWGLMVLVGSGTSVLIGMLVILRMVKIDI